MASQLDNVEELTKLFHVLSNPTRLRIIMLLADGEMSVSALHKKLKVPQSTVSIQIGVLFVQGLVSKRRENHYSMYSLADLTKHRLGRKPEFAKRGSNAAKFGPVELVLPKA